MCTMPTLNVEFQVNFKRKRKKGSMEGNATSIEPFFFKTNPLTLILTLFFRWIDPCFLFFFFSMTVLSSFNIYGLKRDKNKVKSRNVKTIKNMNHYKKNKT